MTARADREDLRRRVDDAVLVLFALVSDGLGWATSALLDQDVARAQKVIDDDEGIDERCAALIALVKAGLTEAAVSPDELEHLVADRDVRVINDDGELLAEFTIDPTKQYQTQKRPGLRT